MSTTSGRHAFDVAAAIIRGGDEIVLVRQAGPGEEPFWALPGGVVEDGEFVPETLAREVREETGLEILSLGRLAHVLQIDDQRSAQFRGRHVPGYFATAWIFEIESWSGELGARDPDGVVSEARFWPVAEAVTQLEETAWLKLAAAYLRGEIEPASFHVERWPDDS